LTVLGYITISYYFLVLHLVSCKSFKELLFAYNINDSLIITISLKRVQRYELISNTPNVFESFFELFFNLAD